MTKRQVREYFSIVRRSAACAALVRASASSRKIILKPPPPIGAVRANSLILPRTTSMPRSSDAFSSWRLCCQCSPNISRASAREQVVLPVPAGPAKSRCGIDFSRT